MLKLRALIVDDSNVYRHIIGSVLEAITGIVVTATANDGQEAVSLVRRKHFDIVFLDVEMPVKDGLQTLKEIRRIQPTLPVIMISGTNRQTTDITIRALEAGAYDFIPKPDAGSSEAGRMALRQQISPLVRSLLEVKSQLPSAARPTLTRPLPAVTVSIPDRDGPSDIALPEFPLPSGEASPSTTDHSTRHSPPGQPARSAAAHRPTSAVATKQPAPQDTPQDTPPSRTGRVSGRRSVAAVAADTAKGTPSKPTIARTSAANSHSISKPVSAGRPSPQVSQFRPKVLVIGVSTGGPAALMTLIPQLDGNLGIPVLIVQHMPANFTASLADSLNGKSRLTVREAISGEPLQANTVYIAPGGYHMEVTASPGERQGVCIALNQQSSVNNCRPSVDVLFASVARAFDRGQVMALVMTGMGRDGADGVAALKQGGNTYCLTQGSESCIVYGMPRAVDEAGLSDEQVPLNELAARLNQLAGARIPSTPKGVRP